MTNPGERLGKFSFGTGLRDLATELAGPEFEQEAMMRITNAVQKYMPYVSLDTFEVRNEADDLAAATAKMIVKVTYSVQKLRIQRAAIEATIFAVG